MAWAYTVIAIGAAGFLIYIFIEYLNSSSSLKPKADAARREISESEMKIEAAQATAVEAKTSVEDMQKEIGELEKELGELTKQADAYKEKERRRKPTKFKLDE